MEAKKSQSHLKIASLQSEQENSNITLTEFTGKTVYCPVCKVDKRVMRYPDKTKPIGFSSYVEACECDIKLERENKEFFENKKRSEIKELIKKLFPFSEELESCTFSNFKKRAGTDKILKAGIKFCDDFDNVYKKNGVGLLFIGNYGGGKSRLAMTILNARRYWQTGIFIEYVTMIDKVLSSYKRESKESTEEIFKCLINCDLLVIDDIGIGEKTPTREQIFLRVLEDRKKLKKPTIFTMNPEGQSQLSNRILSRLNEICIPVECTAEDYRPIVLQEKLKNE